MRKLLSLMLLSSSMYCCAGTNSENWINFEALYTKVRIYDTQVLIVEKNIYVTLPDGNGPRPIDALMRDDEGLFFLVPKEFVNEELAEKGSERHCTVCGKKIKGDLDKYLSHVNSCKDAPQQYDIDVNRIWPKR